MCLEGDGISEKRTRGMTGWWEHVVLTQGTFAENSRVQKVKGWGTGSGLKVMVFRTSGKQTEIFKSQDHSCRSIHLSLKRVFL